MAELLLPAGNTENFESAINNGAGAVYLGLGKFNARGKTAGFDEKNIAEYIRYAHIKGVKVYVTFNILIKDSETEDFLRLAGAAVNARADALIVQDIGAAVLLKERFPSAVLHASTQMGVHNRAGAEILKKLGFDRVILARETKKSDIEEINKFTGLETEYFVHGALCVSFSGNCYFSSFECGKSGNRGECLQLCRLKYKAEDGGKKAAEGYLLSPSDLCFIERLRELEALGIDSFKIEGRLRRKGYVAAAAQCYRLALKGARIMPDALKERLKKVFYRGDFNCGAYLEGPAPCVVNKRYQNHRGILIGEVLNSVPFKNIYEITVVSKLHEIKTGDGLKAVDTSGEYEREVSFGAGSVKPAGDGIYKLYSSAKVKRGQSLFLTMDSAEENAPVPEKKLKAEIYFYAEAGKPVAVKACSGEAVVQISGETAQRAKNAPLTYSEIADALEKTGGTPFEAEVKEISAENVFIPKSVLNALRREVLTKLEGRIIELYNAGMPQGRLPEKSFKTGYDLPADSYAVYNSAENYFKRRMKGRKIVYAPEIYTLTDIENFSDAIASSGEGFFYLELPVYASGAEFAEIEKILSSVGRNKIGVVSNNLWGLAFIEKGFKTVCGAGHNVINKHAAECLLSLGAEDYVNSYENALCGADGAVYEGRIPLMTFVNCPYKTVYGNGCGDCRCTGKLSYISEKGKKFAVRRKKIVFCTFEMLSDNYTNASDGVRKYTDCREEH